jgi:hypothetical protein
LDPLDDPALQPVREWRPVRVAPLLLHAYRLSETRPMASLLAPAAAVTAPAFHEIAPGYLEIDVETVSAATLVVREGWAAGWRAFEAAGSPPIQRDGAGHLSIALPPGRHRLQLKYRPSLVLPWSLGAVGLAGALGLVVAGVPRRRDYTAPETMV